VKPRLKGRSILVRYADDAAGFGSGQSHVGPAGKVDHWRAIDLADLRRLGLLKPIVGGRIKAITWKRDDGWA
jgi:hypothetical protein